MSVRFRFLATLTVLLLALSLTGIAFAQTDGPDPDSPVQPRTPTPSGDGDAEVEPTEELAATVSVPDATPVDNGASPVAFAGEVDIAAMTLDSNLIPADFFLVAEFYTTPQEIADSRAGQIDEEALFATGIQTYYESFYVNADQNRIRTYIIAYETVDGVQAGFDLLEDEDTLVPNGALVDSPGPTGVGETPSEITSGTIENGDGTQTRSYDISYRIDRFEIGVAMETFDGGEIDEVLIDQLAVELADRVAAVIAGDDVDGVDYDLPAELIRLDTDLQVEGYQTATESFIIDDPDLLPDGYVSGYYTGASYSTSISTLLPYVTVGISSFEGSADVEAAMAEPESIMPTFEGLEELPGFDINGAGNVAGFSYPSPEGEGEQDSVRLFMQVDDRLVVVDVQGMPTAEEAEAVAIDLAEAELACVLDGDCEEPISPGI